MSYDSKFISMLLLFFLLILCTLPLIVNFSFDSVGSCFHLVLFCLFLIGADTAVYLALLPAGITEPNGQLVANRKIVDFV